jgi:hypothetical protein
VGRLLGHTGRSARLFFRRSLPKRGRLVELCRLTLTRIGGFVMSKPSTRDALLGTTVPIPAAGAELAGAVQRSNQSEATAALLAPMQGQRPDRSRGGSHCGRWVGAARIQTGMR